MADYEMNIDLLIQEKGMSRGIGKYVNRMHIIVALYWLMLYHNAIIVKHTRRQQEQVPILSTENLTLTRQ
jgi:hypothetical protein